ncbi:T9SS type A sorting domain-containing protein [Flavobacterium sp.]|uniref:T9SS type A sorting domain-containing protein n=1 Tax=Flavobacterium sp. TaxID=239 RepID=UPI00260C2582|nr:T9SS type A sorting domain-containing protein [Flavobacterium sp.]
MIKRLLLFLFPLLGFSQGYTSYFTGNPTNITTTTQFGVCLMGGATENDNAMIWLLNKANGGDVVVLRSTGSNGYNDYLYSDLGVTVNSVETLVITSVAGATNPYVLDKVSKAEMIWFAGGDQWNYISYFKNNALEDLLNNHVNVKHAPIGGTSAGMAILGGYYFSAQNGTVTSAQAMNNPYHPNVTVGGFTGTPYSDFLNIPFLGNTITDTHYDNPDRRGRHATFLARFKAELTLDINGIACNEYVAVCIGSDGIAHVYGDYPNYQEFAYFIQANCNIANFVENCQSGQPLTWNFGGSALKVYKVPGTMNGTNYFQVNNWEFGTHSGGSWEDWGILNGVLNVTTSGIPINCVLGNSDFENDELHLFPNPVDNNLYVEGLFDFEFEIYDSLGKNVISGKSVVNEIEVSNLAKGIYLLKITSEDKTTIKKFIKQ